MFNWNSKLLIIVLASALAPLAFGVTSLPDGWRAAEAKEDKDIMDAHSKTAWCKWLAAHDESSDNIAGISSSYSASIVKVFVDMDYPYQTHCNSYDTCSSDEAKRIDISTPEIASKAPDIFQWGQALACGITAQDGPFADPPVFGHMRYVKFKQRNLEDTSYEMPPAVKKKEMLRGRGLSEEEIKKKLAKFKLGGILGGRFDNHNQKLHAQLCGKLRTAERRKRALSNVEEFEAFYRPVLAEVDVVLDYPNCGYDFCTAFKRPRNEKEIYTPEFFVNTQAASCGWLYK